MRRLFWFAAGAATTVWAERRLRRKVGGEITPTAVGIEAAKTAGRVGRSAARRLGDAVADGRAQADFEQRLLSDRLGVDG